MLLAVAKPLVPQCLISVDVKYISGFSSPSLLSFPMGFFLKCWTKSYFSQVKYYNLVSTFGEAYKWGQDVHFGKVAVVYFVSHFLWKLLNACKLKRWHLLLTVRFHPATALVWFIFSSRFLSCYLPFGLIQFSSPRKKKTKQKNQTEENKHGGWPGVYSDSRQKHCIWKLCKTTCSWICMKQENPQICKPSDLWMLVWKAFLMII